MNGTTRGVTGLVLDEREEQHGRVRLSLLDGDLEACTLTIDPLRLHDGRGGTLALGGIGNVATRETHRRRGLATQLLEVAIERMRADGLDGSLLYGIDHFYEPLGWRTCGSEQDVRILLDERVVEPPDGDVWRSAPAGSDDLPELRACYERIAARTPGALARPAGGRAWAKLALSELHVLRRGSELVGWAWLGRGVHERDDLLDQVPQAVPFLELQALDLEAMRAVVQLAREVARSSPDARGRDELVVGAPEGHPLRALARAGQLRCRLVDELRPHGGAMLLPFSAAARSLDAALYQFRPDRF